MAVPSERQVARIVNRGEAVKAGGRCWRGSNIGLPRRRVLAFRHGKVYVVGQNLNGGAVAAALILIVPALQAAINGNQAAFGKIFGHELRDFVPGRHIKEVCLGLAVGIAAPTVTGNAERSYGFAGRCLPQFRVAHQAAHHSNYIQHRLFLSNHFKFGNALAAHAPGTAAAGGGLFLPGQDLLHTLHDVRGICGSGLHDLIAKGNGLHIAVGFAGGNQPHAGHSQAVLAGNLAVDVQLDGVVPVRPPVHVFLAGGIVYGQKAAHGFQVINTAVTVNKVHHHPHGHPVQLAGQDHLLFAAPHDAPQVGATPHGMGKLRRSGQVGTQLAFGGAAAAVQFRVGGQILVVLGAGQGQGRFKQVAEGKRRLVFLVFNLAAVVCQPGGFAPLGSFDVTAGKPPPARGPAVVVSFSQRELPAHGLQPPSAWSHRASKAPDRTFCGRLRPPWRRSSPAR
nr:MAG TPA: hypothetical protein [Caudoviricetes sp.]